MHQSLHTGIVTYIPGKNSWLSAKMAAFRVFLLVALALQELVAGPPSSFLVDALVVPPSPSRASATRSSTTTPPTDSRWHSERTYDSNRDAHVEPPLILSGTTTEDLNEIHHLGNDDEHASSRRAFLGAMMVSTGFVVANSLSPEAACALEASPNNSNNNSDNDNQRISSASTTTTLLSDAAAVAPPVIDWQSVFQKASKKALGGGKAGASAAVVQVCSLMWLRTSMNYQYRYGGNLQSSLKKLWDEGGVARL